MIHEASINHLNATKLVSDLPVVIGNELRTALLSKSVKQMLDAALAERGARLVYHGAIKEDEVQQGKAKQGCCSLQ